MSIAAQTLAQAIKEHLPAGVRLDETSHLATFGSEYPLRGIDVQGEPARVALEIVASHATNLVALADEVRVSAKGAARTVNVPMDSVDVHVAWFENQPQTESITPGAVDASQPPHSPAPAPSSSISTDGERVEPVASILVHIYSGREPTARSAA